jgi:hypothetical protein
MILPFYCFRLLDYRTIDYWTNALLSDFQLFYPGQTIKAQHWSKAKLKYHEFILYESC